MAKTTRVKGNAGHFIPSQNVRGLFNGGARADAHLLHSVPGVPRSTARAPGILHQSEARVRTREAYYSATVYL